MLKKQLAIYLVIGLLLVLLDFCIFRILRDFGFAQNLSKTISVTTIVIASYFFNAKFTFQSKLSRKSLIVFIFIYAISIFINVIIFSMTINFLAFNQGIAVFTASAVCAVFNFFMQKKFVFQLK
jgi:putative flippase GtrA